jgi:hypothetical protein
MKKTSCWLRSVLVLALSFPAASCGTLMHPDREGQRGGRLDVGVVLLDGIGLFFFIIPGIIAYAVDFSNGTIYLPGGRMGSVGGERRGFRIVKFDPKHCTPESLSAVIRANAGLEIDWRDPRLQAIRLENADQLRGEFARNAPTGASLVVGR